MTQQHKDEVERTEDAKEVQSAPSLSVAPTVEVKEPEIPDGLTAKEQEDFEKLTDAEVRRFIEAKGSEELELEDKIGNVGLKTQRSLSSESGDLTLLQTKMRHLVNVDKKSGTGKLSEDLEKLQDALDSINPEEIKHEFFYQILRLIPGGKRLIRILKEAAKRNETVTDVIEKMRTALRDGQNLLNMDNAQLITLYKRLEGVQLTIRKNAYLAELLMKKLDQAKNQTEDLVKKGRIQNLLFRVSVRAQDLRAMENVYEQGFASIKIIRESNTLLVQSVDRMLTYGMDAVTMGFAIHVALYHQGNVLAAYQETRDFVGKRIKENAEAIARHVAKIGDIYKEPVIAMKMLEDAHAKLISAMDELDKMKVTTVENAKVNIEKLKQMSEDMRNRSNATQTADTVSMEASDLPTRPAGGAERGKI